ncbi:MAG: hypothetical protein ACE5HQ_00465 [Gemmatimonadota bacterium]
MTYEERQQHRQLGERLHALREALEQGSPSAPVSRVEALELLAILEAVIDRLSPERWDRTLEMVAEEASRRAATMVPTRSP